MKGILIYAVFFSLLYLFFRKMFVWMHVSMSGWQFIAFIIVLAAIAEWMVWRVGRRSSY